MNNQHKPHSLVTRFTCLLIIMKMIVSEMYSKQKPEVMQHTEVSCLLQD